MPRSHPTHRDERLEQVVERFEEAHWAGRRPDIEAFLAAAETPDERRRWLVELVHVDLELQLATGREVRVEEYFARFPTIQEDDGEALELITAEFELRSQRDAHLSWDEMLSRFPRFRDRLLELTTIGPFRLLARLGAGTFGVVWKAVDQRLERPVAIKIPHPGRLVLRHDAERFLREGRSLARLHHGGIVAVYEVGAHGGVPFLVSEYVPGPSVADLLAEGRVAPDLAASVVAQVADALAYAHQATIVHRDVKPSNILLRRPVANGTGTGSPTDAWQAKLTDFGLARRTDDESTLTGAHDRLGTPAYMAPEQFLAARSADARSDVYSLGVVLYEMLAGRLPFQGDAAEIVRQVLHDEPPPIRRSSAGISPDLEAVCLKCLEKSPERRYATAGELADDLRRWLRREPTLARPAGTLVRAAKAVRRRPALAAAAMVAVIAAAAVVSVNLLRQRQVSQMEARFSRLETAADQQQTLAVRAGDTNRRLLYNASIRAAHQAWREGDVARLTETLRRYADGTPDADLRHFEWYHLNYLARVPHRALPGHAGEVYAVTYSPDGRLLASGGKDGAVRLWDAETGELLATRKEHASCINSIDFSPDGEVFVTGSCDRFIKLWSVRDRQVIRTLPAQAAEVDCCTFVDGGKLLISLSRGLPQAEGFPLREARIWDVATWSVRTDWPPPQQPVVWMSWARPGRTLVTYGHGLATVWKRRDGGWAVAHEFALDEPFGGFCSPDEQLLLVPGWPSRLRTFRLPDGAEVNHQDARGTGVKYVAFSPDGTRYATCAESLRVWHATSGAEQYRFCTPSDIWHAAWSPTGESIATAGADGVVRIWELRRGKPYLALSPPAVHGPLRTIAHGHKAGRAMAIYGQLSVTWDLSTGQVVAQHNRPGEQVPPGASSLFIEGPPVNATYSPDRRRLAQLVDGGAKGIAIVEAATGQELLRLEARAGAQHVVFAADNTSLLSTDPHNGDILYWPGLQ